MGGGVSTGRNRQNQSELAACWEGVHLHPGTNPHLLHCPHPSALPGKGVCPGGGCEGWTQAVHTTGQLTLNVGKLTASYPVPFAEESTHQPTTMSGERNTPSLGAHAFPAHPERVEHGARLRFERPRGKMMK